MSSLPDNPYVVAIYLVRMAGGVAGCLLFLFVVRRLRWLQRCPLLQKLGGCTLAIYLLQCHVRDFIWIGRFPNVGAWWWLPLTAVIVALCYGVYRLCKPVRLLRFLLFGEQGKTLVRNQGSSAASSFP